jgi:hypothetical protein
LNYNEVTKLITASYAKPKQMLIPNRLRAHQIRRHRHYRVKNKNGYKRPQKNAGFETKNVSGKPNETIDTRKQLAGGGRP